MGCMQSGTAKVKPSGVKELKQNYLIDENTTVLGSGAFGKVFLSHSIKNKDHKVAIKVMNKQKLGEHLDQIKEEVKILTKLDHPNIVRYYETYDDTKYIYLVMEYCPGGELFSKISEMEDEVFGESQAVEIIEKLTKALIHCHATRIIHRDIKAENIMIGKDNEIKLIDFGLSYTKRTGEKVKEIAGTPFYMAPEIITGEYGFEVDYWSLGVLLYILVSGYLPFYSEDRDVVFSKISEADFHFNHKEFDKVSDECKDLISKLLVLNRKERLKGKKLLEHPWFAKFKGMDANVEENKLDKGILNNLKSFKGSTRLKKAAMNMLVKLLDRNQIENLEKEFKKYDRDGTGMVHLKELEEVLKQDDNGIPNEEVERIMSEIDYQGNKKINYSEFLAATIDVKMVLTEERLNQLFQQFDTSNSGFITKHDLKSAFNKLGKTVSEKELNEILSNHDTSKDNKLSLEEFRMIFF